MNIIGLIILAVVAIFFIAFILLARKEIEKMKGGKNK